MAGIIKKLASGFSNKSIEWSECTLFAENTPDFFRCEFNMNLLVDYCNAKDWTVTWPNLTKAHKACWDSEIHPNRETLAKMTAEEVQTVAALNGTPQYDSSGRILGYNLHESWSSAPVVDAPSRYRQKGQMSNPEDFGAKPSKREWAMWSANRQREWMESNGTWNHELPDYLR